MRITRAAERHLNRLVLPAFQPVEQNAHTSCFQCPYRKQLALPLPLRLGRRPRHSSLVPGSVNTYQKLAFTQQCLAANLDMAEQPITWAEPAASGPSLQDNSSAAQGPSATRLWSSLHTHVSC